MNGQTLTSMLTASVAEVPASAAVVAVQQFSLDELRARASSIFSVLSQQTDGAGACRSDRADSTSDDTQTSYRLAQGARAMLYHASGALEYRAAAGRRHWRSAPVFRLP